MSTIHSKDRVSLCTFTFSDGRRCRTPRRPGHPSLCASHARKEAHALAGAEAGEDIARYLSGQFVSACDVSSALGRLFSAVAQGHLKPKTASTLAYLGHVLVQTLPIASTNTSTPLAPSTGAEPFAPRSSPNKPLPPSQLSPPNQPLLAPENSRPSPPANLPGINTYRSASKQATSTAFTITYAKTGGAPRTGLV